MAKRGAHGYPISATFGGTLVLPDTLAATTRPQRLVDALAIGLTAIEPPASVREGDTPLADEIAPSVLIASDDAQYVNLAGYTGPVLLTVGVREAGDFAGSGLYDAFPPIWRIVQKGGVFPADATGSDAPPPGSVLWQTGRYFRGVAWFPFDIAIIVPDLWSQDIAASWEFTVAGRAEGVPNLAGVPPSMLNVPDLMRPAQVRLFTSIDAAAYRTTHLLGGGLGLGEGPIVYGNAGYGMAATSALIVKETQGDRLIVYRSSSLALTSPPQIPIGPGVSELLITGLDPRLGAELAIRNVDPDTATGQVTVIFYP